MSEVPWWALSPSPFTITFWVILAFWGAKQLLQKTHYKRWKHVVAFTDAIFIVGLVVLPLDLMWIVVCGLRFGWLYPSSVLQLTLCGLRDVVGAILCYILESRHFENGTVSFNSYTKLAYLLNLFFLAIWFVGASNPSLTDWTYGMKHDFPLKRVVVAFFISHVLGKMMVTTVYYTFWKELANNPNNNQNDSHR